MKKNYSINDGGLFLCNDMKSKASVYFSYLCQLIKVILVMGSLLLIMYITLVIYNECIKTISLAECIPLGSIFATFGSALISVFCIYNDKQYNLFQENLEILRRQIPELRSWQRWPFLKRYSKDRLSILHSNYYILLNPQITFELNSKSVTVPIPSCTADFKDLSVTNNIGKMICFREQYSKLIYSLYNMKQEDLIIFDCVLTIYKNIIKYKCGTIIIWIGAEFIFSSILFSFFYEQIIEFSQCLTAYF
jgi:hypothetical protein